MQVKTQFSNDGSVVLGITTSTKEKEITSLRPLVISDDESLPKCCSCELKWRQRQENIENNKPINLFENRTLRIV